MPGETPAVFGDALRRLATAATYLYQDGSRYWYSTQATVRKLAEDRAEQLKRNPDAVAKEIENRLRIDLRKTGDFQRVHPWPQSGQDVPDDMDARLVVLGIDHPYSRDVGNRAENAAKAILERRGNTPRLFQNTLVFLAVDQARLQDLDEAVRHFLAWESILADQVKLDLSPHQVKQAEAQRVSTDGTVTARLPETYQWLLVPVQASTQAAVKWEAFRLSGQGPMAERASKKLKNDALLFVSYAGTLLKMELDRVPLWRGNHVAIKQLAEDFARYLYLPRLTETAVLSQAIRDGLGLLTWSQESFAYADSFDEALGRYRGLRCGQIVHISEASQAGLLVRPEPALIQHEADTKISVRDNGGTTAKPGASTDASVKPTPGAGPRLQAQDEPEKPKLTRFHGSVDLDPARVGRDAGRVADEVIAHLAGLIGASVKVKLEIEAKVPTGIPDNVVRIITENSRALKFTSHGCEEE